MLDREGSNASRDLVAVLPCCHLELSISVQSAGKPKGSGEGSISLLRGSQGRTVISESRVRLTWQRQTLQGTAPTPTEVEHFPGSGMGLGKRRRRRRNARHLLPTVSKSPPSLLEPADLGLENSHINKAQIGGGRALSTNRHSAST